jgi:hypothetical protein
MTREVDDLLESLALEPAGKPRNDQDDASDEGESEQTLTNRVIRHEVPDRRCDIAHVGIHIVDVIDNPSPILENEQVTRIRLDGLAILLDDSGLRLFPLCSPEERCVHPHLVGER